MTAEGDHDVHSLTVRGWQRAGELVRLFYPAERGLLTPDALFTSAVAPGSPSLRPRQTIAPLHARLRDAGPVGYNEAFAKPDTRTLMEAVLACRGTVLIAWSIRRFLIASQRFRTRRTSRSNGPGSATI